MLMPGGLGAKLCTHDLRRERPPGSPGAPCPGGHVSPHVRNDPPGNWREGEKRENETVGEDRKEGRELVTRRKDGEGCALSHERSLLRHMAELSSLMGRRREGLSGLPPLPISPSQSGPHLLLPLEPWHQ